MIKKYLIILLVVLASILLVVSYQQLVKQQQLTIKQQQLINEVLTAQKIIADQNNHLHLLDHLFELDSFLLNYQNLDSLINHYQFLKSAAESENYINSIQDRISFIESYSQSSQFESNRIIQLKNQVKIQEKSIQELNSSLASNNAENKRIIDDLKASLKEQSTQLVTQKTEISKKEMIQIITFTSSNGILVHYIGDVLDDKATGSGIGIWTTGSKYQGEWLNNQRHGKGTFLWSDGDKYEGDFQNDIRSGFGVYYFKTGERYDGEWNNNKRNGEGILIDKDSIVTFKGYWIDDKPEMK